MRDPSWRQPTALGGNGYQAAEHDSIQVSIESEPGVALISEKSEKRTIDRFHQKNSEKNLRQPGAFNASQKKRPEQIEFFLNAEGPGYRQGAVAVGESLVVVAHIEKGRPASSKGTSQPAQEPHNIKDRKQSQTAPEVELPLVQTSRCIDFTDQEPGDEQAAQLEKECNCVRPWQKPVIFSLVQVMKEDNRKSGDAAQSIEAGYFALRQIGEKRICGRARYRMFSIL